MSSDMTKLPQSGGAGSAPKPDISALFKLLREQQDALVLMDDQRITELERRIRRDYADLLCLECSCEAAVHTETACMGKHETESCRCQGLKLEESWVGPGDEYEYIPVYTRALAIGAGELVDITKWAAKAGIKYPVAVTAGVWGNWVKGLDTENGRKKPSQEQEGRILDLAFALARAMGHSATVNELGYTIRRAPRMGNPAKAKLQATTTLGDDGRPVLTIELTSTHTFKAQVVIDKVRSLLRGLAAKH